MRIFLAICIIFLLIPFSILFLLIGENGYNSKCKNANSCSGSIRCNAKSKSDLNCFEEKRRIINYENRIKWKN